MRSLNCFLPFKNMESLSKFIINYNHNNSGNFNYIDIIKIFILLFHSIIILNNIYLCSAVNDELANIPSGVYHWRSGRFEAACVNPPLARLVSALPVMMACPGIGITLKDDGAFRPEWIFSKKFMYENLHEFENIVCLARLPGVFWSTLAAIVIFRWGRDLFGAVAGLFVMGLWCFDPLVLGFAGIATPDVPAAASGVLSGYLAWRYFKQPSWGRAGIAGVGLGIAQLTKFTNLVLYIMIIFMMFNSIYAIYRWSDKKPFSQCANSLTQYIFVIVLSLFIINCGYFFENLENIQEEPVLHSAIFADFSGNDNSTLGDQREIFQRIEKFALSIMNKILPSSYLRGIDIQLFGFEIGRPVYLNGQWHAKGRLWYYLYVILLKFPVGSIVLVMWGLIITVLDGIRDRSLGTMFYVLLPSVLILIIASTQVGINRHARYLLPAVPYLFVTSGIILRKSKKILMKIFAIVLLYLFSVASSLGVHPHYMSYFNELAGGPYEGHRYLLGSSVDWGQDLISLRRWLAHHPEASSLKLAYYGGVDPYAYGIMLKQPPQLQIELAKQSSNPWSYGPIPGMYAVSVSYLHGAEIYDRVNEYAIFYNPSVLGLESAMLNYQVNGRYEYFKYFENIDHCGISIFIYKISYNDAQRVRRKLGLPPLDHVPVESPVD